MNNRYNLLSIDPMYSPLHERVADIVAKKKYAVTSCLSKKIYLPTFKLYSAASIIRSNRQSIDNELLKKIGSLSSYHHSYVKKIENRDLSSDELVYMASFYIGLKDFIIDNEIELVILHNDTRWYHAIAILICKELGLPYLVTEQGLIRPNTTIIDNKGVNATANISLLDKKININRMEFNPKRTHNSGISMFYFFIFTIAFNFERLLFGNCTVLKYMHNNYNLKKYASLFFKRIKTQHITNREQLYKPQGNYALLILQLELDSQFLMYSEFASNQELLERVYKKCLDMNIKLAVKKHPLDLNEYKLSKEAFFVDGDLKYLITNAKLVITVNSSAILSVLESNIPLYIVGESMYELEKCDIESIDMLVRQDIGYRKEYVKKLKSNYLIKGAGYDYCMVSLKMKLEQLLN